MFLSKLQKISQDPSKYWNYIFRDFYLYEGVGFLRVSL